jgi:hypothetical protein
LPEVLAVDAAPRDGEGVAGAVAHRLGVEHHLFTGDRMLTRPSSEDVQIWA